MICGDSSSSSDGESEEREEPPEEEVLLRIRLRMVDIYLRRMEERIRRRRRRDAGWLRQDIQQRLARARVRPSTGLLHRVLLEETRHRSYRCQ
ncbi:hypothetical protein FJT64_010152 [Amphibalanus amphitrite]|uniref:Uncharacterized protein n=1 Tax=Amphibalanus amphitrite TaxID=1232801 RepID=A0A6A4VJQ5_AMPAM|nr:hypothetical protein FJT64_010152 [Amphibalanus amphitrite]